VHDPRQHLALANRHLMEADERIARQRHRIERMRRAACYTGDAEDLLALLLQTRELMLPRQKRLEREVLRLDRLGSVKQFQSW
jgi:hypothetical protein